VVCLALRGTIGSQRNPTHQKPSPPSRSSRDALKLGGLAVKNHRQPAAQNSSKKFKKGVDRWRRFCEIETAHGLEQHNNTLI